MKKKESFQLIKYATLLVVGSYFLIIGMFKASPFLIPISIGILLSVVMLPVAKKLQKFGLSRGLATLLSDLVLLVFCSLLVFIVGLQINQIVDNWPKYEKKLQPKLENTLEYVSQKTGMSTKEIKSEMEKFSKKSEGASPRDVGGYLKGVFSFMGNFLLVFVYVFFLLYYRHKFKESILGFVPEMKRDKAKEIIDASSKVIQQYLSGRFILILILAGLYLLGLSILGVKHAILVSLIAAVLSLIPYVGNLVGYGLALLLGIITSGGLGIVLGVTIVFGVAQFVESYVLEPFIVGDRVDLNPSITIIGVVLFGAIWGLAGMVISIPLMGIIKVISDNVPVLHPVGYTLGNEDISTDSTWMKKVKEKVKKMGSRS